VIPRLWYITDGERGTAGRPLRDVIERAAAGGVEAVLLRERGLPAAALAQLVSTLAPLRARGLRLLISRRLDLARALDLDGVQLAADAVPVAEARAWLGAGQLIGYSAHQPDEARRVAREGASYVMLSPIYSTESKPGAVARGPEWLQTITPGLAIPALALGGMTPERTHEVCKAGAWGVAAVSAIGAAPDVTGAARRFHRSLAEIH
jgi:thiamine-phosphate pyrophosphorylase